MAETSVIEANGKTARNVKIARLYIEGKTADAIAAEVGLSSRQVWRILKETESLKEIIAGAVEANVEGLAEAIKRHNQIIESGDDSVALKAIGLRYEVAGVRGTHTQSPVLQQIYVDNRGLIDSEALAALQKLAQIKLRLGLEDEAVEQD